MLLVVHVIYVGNNIFGQKTPSPLVQFRGIDDIAQIIISVDTIWCKLVIYNKPVMPHALEVTIGCWACLMCD